MEFWERTRRCSAVRNLLGLTQEDQPDRPVTMIPTPPMPVKIDATDS